MSIWQDFLKRLLFGRISRCGGSWAAFFKDLKELFFFLHLKDLLHGFTRLLVCGNLKDLLQLSCDNLETHSEGFQKD